MPNRLRMLSCAALLAGAGLVIVPRVAHAQGLRDLDKLPTAELDADLEAELDAIYVGHSHTELVDLDELEDEIMTALSDEGDEGKAGEISLEDINAEMEEDNTTLEAVVERALHEVDQASAPRLHGPRFVFVGFRPAPEAFRTTRELAVKQTKKDIIKAIQEVRR